MLAAMWECDLAPLLEGPDTPGAGIVNAKGLLGLLFVKVQRQILISAELLCHEIKWDGSLASRSHNHGANFEIPTLVKSHLEPREISGVHIAQNVKHDQSSSDFILTSDLPTEIEVELLISSGHLYSLYCLQGINLRSSGVWCLHLQ